jgi:hypothetical protein
MSSLGEALQPWFCRVMLQCSSTPLKKKRPQFPQGEQRNGHPCRLFCFPAPEIDTAKWTITVEI